jgi:hypothetical protein
LKINLANPRSEAETADVRGQVGNGTLPIGDDAWKSIRVFVCVLKCLGRDGVIWPPPGDANATSTCAAACICHTSSLAPMDIMAEDYYQLAMLENGL